MPKHYYFLLTTDDGPAWRLSCSRRRLRQIGTAAAVFVILCVGLSLRSVTLGVQSASLQIRVAALEQQLTAKDSKLLAQQQLSQEEQERLGAKVAALTTEKDTVLAAAVRELSSRSALIDKMLEKIGLNPESAGVDKAAVAVHTPKNTLANSGGPFIALEPPSVALLNRVDRHLAILSTLPLGIPTTSGSITSTFGNRIDPLNWRRAFHSGIDFKGEGSGGKIFATADGLVKEADWNGSFGRYVEIDHGNGYTTAYAHLSQFTVQAGNRVQRGQLIGYIGSSGRSTGPHLHYELRYQGLPIDPAKYARIAATMRAEGQTLRKR